MCLASTTRQPCSAGSCIAVTRNWPFGLNGGVMVRALPFQEFRRGLRVRKPHRHAVVVGDREPHALRREGEPADGGLHLDATSARPCRPARRPACRPTTPPRRRARWRHDRSSGAWRRSRRARLSPLASVANTLPSSPPVMTVTPSLAADRMPPPWMASRFSSPLSATSSTRFLAQHEGRGAAEEMHGHHRRARRDDAGALDDGGGVGRGVSHGSLHLILRSGRSRVSKDGRVFRCCHPSRRRASRGSSG